MPALAHYNRLHNMSSNGLHHNTCGPKNKGQTGSLCFDKGDVFMKYLLWFGLRVQDSWFVVAASQRMTTRRRRPQSASDETH